MLSSIFNSKIEQQYTIISVCYINTEKVLFQLQFFVSKMFALSLQPIFSFCLLIFLLTRSLVEPISFSGFHWLYLSVVLFLFNYLFFSSITFKMNLLCFLMCSINCVLLVSIILIIYIDLLPCLKLLDFRFVLIIFIILHHHIHKFKASFFIFFFHPR